MVWNMAGQDTRFWILEGLDTGRSECWKVRKFEDLKTEQFNKK